MKRLITGTAIALMAITLTACKIDSTTTADDRNKAAQGASYSQATSTVPVPQTTNYLARKNIAEYMRRMDSPEKLFYVYERGMNGNTVGYFVSRTYPQSICTFMTPPERLINGDGVQGTQDYVMTAPALDGVFYKGGGCDIKFWFDAETDAMILSSMKLTVADQPLSLEADPVSVIVAD